MTSSKKIYFLSDFHLGAPNAAESLVREKRIIRFLDEIKNDAAQIFILGDLFDFWFEYKKVVPKGYVRILGKLAEITDAGIPIHFFVGNHDMWMRDYFQKELNIPVYFEPVAFDLFGKKFLIGHGDGLGPAITGINSSRKYSGIKPANGCLVFYLLISAWGLQIISVKKAGPKPAKQMRCSWEKIKNGSSFIVRKCLRPLIMIILFLATGIYPLTLALVEIAGI